MANTSQLIKENKAQGGHSNVFPKTFIDAIKDRETGQTLSDILNGFNMYFLSYVGNREKTRLQVPNSIRRRGLYITYVDFSGDFHSEYYNCDNISDDEFDKDDNWINGNNRLVGDLSISVSGNWVINGVDTGVKAIAEIDLEQNTGDRIEATMSQKAITDAINSGDSNLQSQITELQNSTFPLTGSFSVSPSLFEYTGQNVSISVSWNIQRKGTDVVLNLLNIKRTINSSSTNIVNSRGNHGNYTDQCTNNGDIVYNLTASGEGLNFSRSVTITGVLPMYFGGSNNETVHDIKSFTKQAIKSNPSGTYNITLSSNGYVWFCVPNNMTINRITLNGFDVPLEAYASSSTSLGSYKCYRTSNELISGSYQFVIS